MKTKEEILYDEGCNKLVDAVVELAVKDYYSALKAVHKNPHDMEARFRLNEVKSFFLSDWFFTLTEGDGRIFIEKIEKMFKEKNKCELL